MKHRYVFLLGRPGCGKSALYRELEKQILESGQAKTFERIDDFPRLWAKFQADDALEKAGQERIYTRGTDDGDYLITNDSILDDVLQEVNSDALKNAKPDHVVFIEFARSDYVQAVQHFDKQILDNCIAIYVQVSFDTCWARNVARHKATIAQGGDDHLVSREEMAKRYLEDDQDAFVRHMVDRGIPVLVVDNEPDGKAHLTRQVQELFETLF